MEVPSETSCWSLDSNVELKQLELFMTGLDELLHARYINLRSARQLLVSLEKLHEPTKGDVI